MKTIITTAIDAVNNGEQTPDAYYNKSTLVATSKWHSTDGWRGYYKIAAEPGYKIVLSDWLTGNWSDAPSGHSETEINNKLDELEKEYGNLIIIYTPTSNVFSTAIDVLVATGEEIDKGKLTAHKTRRWDKPDGSYTIRYHATNVVEYDAKTNTYTLNTGGWDTRTTVARMNEYTPFRVYRKNSTVYAEYNGKVTEVSPVAEISL